LQEKPFTEIPLKTYNRSLERSKWMKPCSVAEDQASEAGGASLKTIPIVRNHAKISIEISLDI